MRIGVIDSGVGGLTTLKCLVSAVPLDYYYYMDNANVPYGEKSEDELWNIAVDIMNKMRDMDIVVVACNTLSGVVGDRLRRVYRMPILLMEPSIKPATSNGHRALVIATNATLHTSKFLKLLSRYPNVQSIGSSTLAYYIEHNMIAKARDELDKTLNGIDKNIHIVLGCTHYVYLKSYIESKGYKVYEGNTGVTKRLESIAKGKYNMCDRGRVYLHHTAPVDMDKIQGYLNEEISMW